jgi:preprotein translocase subunit SecY
MFLMWLGEQITARGIGNGISLIIFAGIVAELPSALAGTLELGRTGALSTGLILGIIMMAIVVIAFIVFMERAQRRLLIQYPKRQVGNRMFAGRHLAPAAQAQHGRRHPADLRLLAAAAADHGGELLRRPGAGLAELHRRPARPRPAAVPVRLRRHDRLLRLLLHGDRVQSEGHGRQPEEARRLHSRHPAGRAHGGIHRLRADPGPRSGALYLALVCLLPEILISHGRAVLFRRHVAADRGQVTMDTVAQVQGHLLAQQYEGLIKKSKLRGARR